MTRLGPWVLCAGLALLVAGVVSSRAKVWKENAGIGERTQTVDVAGIDTLDLRGSKIRTLIINDGAATVRYPADMKKPPAWHREGHALVFDANNEEAYGQSIELPSQVQHVLADGRVGLSVTAKMPAAAMRIEGSTNLDWSGDAGALELRELVQPTATSGFCGGGSGWISFNKGRVKNLRIVSVRDDVHLHDLSQVGDVEIQAGPKVGLHVDNIGDLGKLHVVPLPLPAADSGKACKWSKAGDEAAADIE